MKTARSVSIAAGLSLALAAAPALAHHSAAMYDRDHPITVSGVVKDVNWVNPHITIELLVDGPNGAPAQTWTVGASSPGVMTRSGWTKRSFNPGDKVSFQIAPLRTGGTGGDFLKATLANGQVLTWSFKPGQQ